MFTNYSQTYASAITTLAGLIVSMLSLRGISILPYDVEFLLGMVVNFIGIVWTIYHRYQKGDVTLVGKRV